MLGVPERVRHRLPTVKDASEGSLACEVPERTESRNNMNDENLGVKLQGEFDAAVWTDAFLATVAEHPELPTDWGAMVGWFANAIMAGYDHAYRTIPELAREHAEVIVLPRDALLEFFGEMALPPWVENGEVIGGTIDCAPIASRISDWLREHDLTGSVALEIA